MKKLFMKGAVMSMMLMASVCAQAQINLGNVLNSVASSASGSSAVSTLTSVFSSNKQATSDNIVGTWVYSEPAIVFTSNNVLTQTASKIAAKKIASKLQTELNKYGIKKGAMTVTFASDGKFTETIKGKKMSGTWKISNSKLQLTYVGVQTISITTQISGSNLQLVTDATKLLSLFKTMANASGNTSIQTVSSLMSNVKGMQAGLALSKK
jgi:hypothetical protein